MADDFTRRKFSWLDQIARDRQVSAEAFRLAYILASDHLNRGTGDAWPSQDKLAEKLGLRSPRSIKHLVDQLAARGHLGVTVGRGRGHSNRYAPLLHAVDSITGTTADATLFPELGGAPHRRSGAAVVDNEAAFEAWWIQYPRQVGRGLALRAFERIITGGTANAEDLTAGAMRYAAERDGQDPKFTKHPTTWLNGECWRDETALPANHNAGNMRTPYDHATGAMSAIAGVSDWLDGGEDR